MPFDTHSKANLPPLSILKKIQFFFQKTHLFFQPPPPPNFERFENACYSSRILPQNLLTLAIKKIKICFGKLNFFFIRKTTSFERFEKSYYFSRILQQIF